MPPDTTVTLLLLGEVKAQLLRSLHMLDAMGVSGAGAYVSSALSAIEDEISTEISTPTMVAMRNVDFTDLDRIIDGYFGSGAKQNEFIAQSSP